MWLIQNADIFLLSRYVSNEQLGLYTLASRTGFMVAFLPQAFRMALRPIRKAAVFKAYRREYGTAVAQGQLLAYFVLITLTAVLAMVLGGEILVQIGGPKFEEVASIVPLTAAAMSMPALHRTVNSMANFPNKLRTFSILTVGAALLYVGLVLLLLSQTEIGIYAAPIGMLVAFAIPITYMFLRSQLGADPIEFPYLAMLQATLVASGLAVAYHFAHPDGEWVQLPVIALVMGIWITSLFLLRIIPPYHWHPIRHIALSAIRGSALRFDVGLGLGSLELGERGALRAAVIDRLPADDAGSLRRRERGWGGWRRRSWAPAPTRTPRRRARGSCACFARPAAAAGFRSPRRASSTPGSRCSCSRTGRRRCGRRRCASCSRPAPAPTTCARWRTFATTSHARPRRPGPPRPTPRLVPLAGGSIPRA